MDEARVRNPGRRNKSIVNRNEVDAESSKCSNARRRYFKWVSPTSTEENTRKLHKQIKAGQQNFII